MPSHLTPSRPGSPAKKLAVVTAGLLLPGLALAHVGADAGAHHGTLAAVAAGFVHPFTGADHLLAMVGLGVWSATGARRVWAAPLAFALMLLIGALLGRAGVALPAVEPMIATSLLVIGLLAATSARLPTAAGVVVAAVFALFHGAAHGQEFGGAAGAEVLAGLLVATCVLHATGLVIGHAFKSRSAWWPRVAGAAVAAFGAGLLVAMPLAA